MREISVHGLQGTHTRCAHSCCWGRNSPRTHFLFCFLFVLTRAETLTWRKLLCLSLVRLSFKAKFFFKWIFFSAIKDYGLQNGHNYQLPGDLSAQVLIAEEKNCDFLRLFSKKTWWEKKEHCRCTLSQHSCNILSFILFSFAFCDITLAFSIVGNVYCKHFSNIDFLIFPNAFTEHSRHLETKQWKLTFPPLFPHLMVFKTQPPLQTQTGRLKWPPVQQI